MIIGSLTDNYSNDEFEYIVKHSKSIREVLDKLGYKTHNGRNYDVIKKRIDKLGIGGIPMRFILNSNEYRCRYGSIYIEGKTKYIPDGTIIFYGGKTLLVSEVLPDHTGDLAIDCENTKFDKNYYDVLSIKIDGKTYYYNRVSI